MLFTKNIQMLNYLTKVKNYKHIFKKLEMLQKNKWMFHQDFSFFFLTPSPLNIDYSVPNFFGWKS